MLFVFFLSLSLALWQQHVYDTDKRAIVLGEVPLLDKPQAGASEISRLYPGNYVYVSELSSGGYTQIVCPGERTGWVKTDFIEMINQP